MSYVHVIVISSIKDSQLFNAEYFCEQLLNRFGESAGNIGVRFVAYEWIWGSGAEYSGYRKKVIEKALSGSHIFINVIDKYRGVYPLVEPYLDRQKDFSRFNQITDPWERQLLKRAHEPWNNDALFLLVEDKDCEEERRNSFSQCPGMNVLDLLFRQVANDQLCVLSHSCKEIFYTKVYDWLTSRLSYFHPEFLYQSKDRIREMIDRQANYLNALNFARPWTRDLHDLETYVMPRLAEPNRQGKPVVLLAEHDQSSRALVASLASKLMKCQMMEKIIFHMVTLDADSQDIKLFLLRILHELSHPLKDDDLPLTVDQMASHVSSYLSGQVRGYSDVTIILSGADQLRGDKYAAQALSWIPNRLGDRVTVVLSLPRDCYQCKNLSARDNAPLEVDLTPALLDESSLSERGKLELLHPDHRPMGTPFAWIVAPPVSKMNSLLEYLDTVLTAAPAQPQRRPSKRISKLTHAQPSPVSRPRDSELLACVLRVLCASVRGLYWDELVELVAGRVHAEEREARELAAGKLDPFLEKDQLEKTEKEMKVQGDYSLPFASLDKLSPIQETRSRVLDTRLCGCVAALGWLVVKVTLTSRGQAWVGLSHPLVRAAIQHRLFAEHAEEQLWCTRLGEFFLQRVSSVERQMEEIPTCLVTAGQTDLLAGWLRRWPVMERLFTYSTISLELLRLWRSVCGHCTDYGEMVRTYMHLARFQMAYVESVDRQRAWERVLIVSRIFMQSGNYTEAKELARSLLKTFVWSDAEEEYQCPTPPEQDFLSEVYFLLFEIMDERLKIFDFVTQQQNHILKRALHYGSRAILLKDGTAGGLVHTMAPREEANGRLAAVSEHRLALFLMRFAFALDGWEQCGCHSIYSGEEVRRAAERMLHRAELTFKKLKDRQLLAEAKMTQGVIEPRHLNAHKTELYQVPLREARVFFGDLHILISRLYINIGICHEEAERYVSAFQYFSKWSEYTELLLGANHPKTRRTRGVFQETRYQHVSLFFRSLNGQPVTPEVEAEFHVFESQLESFGSQPSRSMADLDDWGETSPENAIAIAAAEEAQAAGQESEYAASDDETPSFVTAFQRVIDMHLSGRTNFIDEDEDDMDDDSTDSFLINQRSSMGSRLTILSSDDTDD